MGQHLRGAPHQDVLNRRAAAQRWQALEAGQEPPEAEAEAEPEPEPEADPEAWREIAARSQQEAERELYEAMALSEATAAERERTRQRVAPAAIRLETQYGVARGKEIVRAARHALVEARRLFQELHGTAAPPAASLADISAMHKAMSE